MELREATRWRWVLWGLLALGFVLVSFHRVSSAVLADDLARAFDTTGTELGFLHASFFYIYAAMQLPSGIVVDRFGPRRVAAGGLAVLSVGVLGFAVAESYVLGFVARAVIGLGGAVLYPAILRFAANWFRPDEFATVTGWTVSVAGLGGVLAATPLALAVEATGWRPTIAAAGVVGIAVAALIWLAVRDRPRDAGTSISGVRPPEAEADFATVLANSRRVLGDRETWLMGGLLFFVIGTNFTVLGLWGVPYIVHVFGADVQTASYVVLAGNLGYLVSAPVFGWLSDRTGRRTSLVLAATAGFTLAYGVIFVVIRPPLAVVAILLFCGLCAMGGASLTYTVAKERHDAAASGTAVGTINGIGYAGAAVVPALMGYVLDAYWTGQTVSGARVYTVAGYRVAFGIATTAGVVATFCAAWLHYRAAADTPATADPDTAA